MTAPLNDSEKFVHLLSTKTCLSLWCYANPQGKERGKELCDVLVVCEPDILIISVKEAIPTESGSDEVDWKRWRKKAIDESVKQIYGAERFLRRSTDVIKRDGTKGLPLPSDASRRIHRIAVAFGSAGRFPILFGDFGKGFVHVFDEKSLQICLGALDTVSDLVAYLIDKEELYASGVNTMFEGSEEDMLAFYLHQGRTFPTLDNGAVMVIGNDLWDQFEKKPEVIAKTREDQVSYVWDRLIESISADILTDNLEFGGLSDNAELVIRTMAREDRFSRRQLGTAFTEFLRLAAEGEIKARSLLAPSGVQYVFLAASHYEAREYRTAELAQRCLVARSKDGVGPIVVGIATEKPVPPGKGHSFDVIYFEALELSETDLKKAQEFRNELGLFKNPRFTRQSGDEYPSE